MLGCSSQPAVDRAESDVTGGDSGAGASTTWQTLVEGDWSMPAGSEGYVCVRATVPEDIYVSGFSAISPLGTHHTLLTAEPDSDEPDEVFDCNASTNGPRMLFGSGVGTNDIHFPEGVAVKLEAGSRVLLNLHLFNTSTETLTGRSGTLIDVMSPDEVEHEAEGILAGKVAGLTVEPGITTQTGSCTMSHDVTIFAAAPHMHQLGSHMKTVAVPANGEPRVLVDAPYSFDEQIYYPVDPLLELSAGDRITVECGYTNPGPETVYFGDSTTAEMCFTGIYRYPKGEGESFICTEGGTGITLPGPACAEDGAPGNDHGVGKHCSAGGDECGDSALCLADYTEGDFGNFCTLPCHGDDDCGEGATCAGTSQTVCIPDECLGTFQGDAGAP